MTGNLFVVFEGGEGAGKSTQVNELAMRLRDRGRTVVETFEPGATALGAGLRQMLLRLGTGPGGADIDPWAEALLYAADRAQHVAEIVQPSLDRGNDVISDRFVWSSVAYQGVARGLGEEAIAGLNEHAIERLSHQPIVIVLDVPVEVGLARVGNDKDRIEAEGKDFHNRVRETFIRLAEREKAPIVDATRPLQELSKQVWQCIRTSADERGIEL